MKYIQYLNLKKMLTIDKSCQICKYYETANIDDRNSKHYFCSKGDKKAHYLYHCNLFEFGMSDSMKKMEVVTCKKEINRLHKKIKELETGEI